MRHIQLDREADAVKRFVRSLCIDPDGSVLELGGKPLFKLLPVKEEAVDERKLRAAIRNRRDASRQLNQEWKAVNRETWDGPGPSQE